MLYRNGKDVSTLISRYFGPILTLNGTWEGDTLPVTVDDASVVFGDLLYQAADFNYERADASVIATMPALVMALASGTGLKRILFKGQICNTSWNWNAGVVFVSITTGEMVQSPPSGSAEIVQVIGWALSADTIFFAPNSTTLEIT